MSAYYPIPFHPSGCVFRELCSDTLGEQEMLWVVVAIGKRRHSRHIPTKRWVHGYGPFKLLTLTPDNVHHFIQKDDVKCVLAKLHVKNNHSMVMKACHTPSCFRFSSYLGGPRTPEEDSIWRCDGVALERLNTEYYNNVCYIHELLRSI